MPVEKKTRFNLTYLLVAISEGNETKEVPFAAYRVDPKRSQKLDQYGVTFRGQTESTFLRDLLSWVLPVLLFVGLWRLLPGRTRVPAPG